MNCDLDSEPPGVVPLALTQRPFGARRRHDEQRKAGGCFRPIPKLNHNACKLGESRPVTVGFSDAVGEILSSNPTVTDRRPNFKYSK